jgi:glycosyltransferase involved in cell wall biosynthesis
MVKISIVSVHCVKNDAISNVMKTYSDWLRMGDGYSVKSYGYHTEYTQEELPFRQIDHVGQLLLDVHFQNSSIVIFQFGIYYPLMDLISLIPIHAKALVIFHNVTPKKFMALHHHDLIDKSFVQLHNLKLADYVMCDSETNLRDLRKHGIRTPASVLPLWFKKIYGAPRYKPSFYDRITRIVFLGRFVRSKGGLDLLKAIEQHLAQTKQSKSAKPLELTVIFNQKHSDSALLEEAQIHASALEVTYKGRVKVHFVFSAPDSVKFQILQAADIFALPTYHEGFCVPILEALSNNCRVVAYNNSNVPFVAGVDAHLAETGNIKSLTEHLTSAISIVNTDVWWTCKNGSYLAFADRCREHLNQFSAGKARKRLLSLLEKLTNSTQKLENDLDLLNITELALPEVIQKVRPKGLNVIGFLSSILGLGEAARAILHGLKSQCNHDWPLELINLHMGHFPILQDKTFDNFDSEFKYAINLIMLNPSEHEYATNFFGISNFQGRYNIGLWYWELVDVIEEWRVGSKLIDELWVTTDYIRDNMLQFTSAPVYKITIPISFDMSKINADRRFFGLPKNTFLFIFAFDYNSIMSRKNPGAVIEAFRLAFGDRKDVGLVIKSINSDKQPEYQSELKATMNDLNVFVIDGEMDKYQNLSLYAACDSYASLHRAEGFGLALAECMYLGKPVIATGYSGNMEFMNHDNSFPVRYNMVQILEDHDIYRKGQWWAEPDKLHAAACMQALVNDPNLCKTTGEKAKLYIQTHFSLNKSYQSMCHRLNDLTTNPGVLSKFVDFA